MNKVTFALLVVLIFIIAALVGVNKQLSEDCKTYKSDRAALLEDVKFYRTKDSLSVGEVQKLTLSRDEFRQRCSELSDLCDELNIKIKRLKSTSKTATASEYKFNTRHVDSIIIRDSIVIDTIKCFSYSNNYIDFRACEAHDNALSVYISTVDTLDQLVHKVPRRFLFFRYGCKAIKQTVLSRNPYSTITYSDYIELR